MQPLDQVAANMAMSLGLDEKAINERKAYLEISGEDVTALKSLHDALHGLKLPFIQDFYNHLLRFKDTKALIQDASSLKRLQHSQAAYFDSLTAGEYGPEYVHHRLRVGLAHYHVGLKPEWYLGAYSKYLAGLIPEINNRLGQDRTVLLQTIQALIKIALLDISLAMDTYIEAGRRSVESLREYANLVFSHIPAGLVVLSSDDYRILSSNRAFQRHTGLGNQELEGLRFPEIISFYDSQSQKPVNFASLAGNLAGTENSRQNLHFHLGCAGLLIQSWCSHSTDDEKSECFPDEVLGG